MLQYYAFYKPYQTLCQFSPEGDKQTLAHWLPLLDKDIYPIGRLDYDSEGLLLLSNDKKLNHQLLTPSHQHPRTYYAQVEGAITSQAIQQLCNGVSINIDGKAYATQKAVASILQTAPDLPPRNPPIRQRLSVSDSWLSLTLIEGKNRQVRRMTAAVGFPTLRLVRYSMMHINIGNMQPGECISLPPKVIQKLWK
jgi:23S rRNA pseudouridine2457 synthase